MLALPLRHVSILLAAALVPLAGCATGPDAGAADPERDRLTTYDPPPPPPADDPRTLPVADGRTGTTLDWATLVERASSADIVLLGEVHDHRNAHAIQEALSAELLQRFPSTYALSFEFFERDRQSELDDLRLGVRTEIPILADEKFPAAHRRMAEEALGAGRPVIAANAPRRYVTHVRKQGRPGFDALTEDQSRLIVYPDQLTGGDYEARFNALMSGMMASHSPQPVHSSPGEGDNSASEAAVHSQNAAIAKMVEAFYRSQNAWDATMADSIARAYDAGHRPILHVVGQFHTDHEGGLTERVRTLRPGARVVVISLVADESDAPALPEPSSPRADLLVEID